MAKDKDVDLVICSVRVDRHLSTLRPSLLAGKNVYVEWPLGKNLAEAEELLRLKNEGGVQLTVVGLQARQAPVIKLLKNLVEEGRIGKVLSTTWTAQAGNGGGMVNERYEYLGRKEVGGNLMTIHFGHAVDYIQYVLGYGFSSPPKSLLANRRPFVQLLGDDWKVIEEKHPTTADDTIFLIGTLASGIPLSFTLRGGKAFKGSPGLEWRIYGEKGEIKVTASGPFLQIGYEDLKVEMHDFERDTVEVVEVKGDEFDALGMQARNVARVYRGIEEGRNNCSFEDAVERHRLIDQMYRENGYQA